MYIVSNFVNTVKNATDFNGRMSRADYWFFILANILLMFGLFVFSAIAGALAENILGMGAMVGILFLLIYALFSLVITIVSISAGVRRLHDSGKTGWLMLVMFIPAIGTLVFLYFMALPGDEGANEFGGPVG